MLARSCVNVCLCARTRARGRSKRAHVAPRHRAPLELERVLTFGYTHARADMHTSAGITGNGMSYITGNTVT